ncbi:MAG: sigma-70 family RNA polymerase sigma factor [Planctomycetes bacterium]|nr:sigma-70 family RNA polymerase sigma factor [Planctomycetota bacterium]
MSETMNPQDASRALIARAQAGDRQAFDELAGRYRGRIASFVRHRLRAPLESQVELEDVVQETLLRAYQSMERIRWSDEESFQRWLRGIAANVVFELASQARRRPVVPLEADGDIAAPGISDSKACEREERFERLKGALGSLSPEHRQVIQLARIQRLPVKDVARLMKRTPGAVTQLLWRALQKLRQSFGDTESLSLPARSLAEGGPGAEAEGAAKAETEGKPRPAREHETGGENHGS